MASWELIELRLSGIHGSDGIVNVTVEGWGDDGNVSLLYNRRWAAVEHIYEVIADELWRIGEEYGGADACHRDSCYDTGSVEVSVVWNGKGLSELDLAELEQNYYDWVEEGD